MFANSIAAKVVSIATLALSIGVQGAHAASQRIFIGTAQIPLAAAQMRCNNVAAQVGGSRAVVTINYLKMAQCDLISPRPLTDAESQRFGRSFTYGRIGR
jgi:hypothetical protein